MIDALILTILMTSVPLVLAATGELVVERSGVLNLGLEGMMLMGAVSAFALTYATGSLFIGLLAGIISGAITAAIFGFFVLGLATNQVATGLALTIFGTGLSGLIGSEFVGKAITGLPTLFPKHFADIPICWRIPLIRYRCLFLCYYCFSGVGIFIQDQNWIDFKSLWHQS